MQFRRILTMENIFDRLANGVIDGPDDLVGDRGMPEPSRRSRGAKRTCRPSAGNNRKCETDLQAPHSGGIPRSRHGLAARFKICSVPSTPSRFRRILERVVPSVAKSKVSAKSEEEDFFASMSADSPDDSDPGEPEPQTMVPIPVSRSSTLRVYSSKVSPS